MPSLRSVIRAQLDAPHRVLKSATCASLAELQLQGAAITAAESVAAGPIIAGDAPVRVAVAFCRVGRDLEAV